MTVRSIGIFYGSSGGATADVAGQIADSLLSLTGLRVTLADIAKTDVTELPGRFCQVKFSKDWLGKGGLKGQAARSATSFQV